MNSRIMEWAIRNQVSERALSELRDLFNMEPDIRVSPEARNSEAYTQSLVRLEAAHKGVKLWRNNVGALLDQRGVPIRYGLANDSRRLNETIKSGDLIGWRPILVTPAHVGSHIAQFVSRECKRPGWNYTGDEHEQAQLRWAEVVMKDGGDAAFCTGEGTL